MWVIIVAIFLILIASIGFAKISKLEFVAQIGKNNQGIDEHNGWFKNQIANDGDALKIYEALEYMNENGLFKNGADYDICNNKYITEDKVKNYANGDMSLISKVEKGVNAFLLDYPELFYIDFSHLSIRVTMDDSKNYHAYLGSGNFPDYFIKGFNKDNIESSITAYDAKVDEIIQYANNDLINDLNDDEKSRR